MWSMHRFAVEQQRIPGSQGVLGIPVPVHHDPFEHVEHLGTGMLELRKDLAGFGQRDQHRLQALMCTSQGAEQLVVVSDTSTAPDNFGTPTAFGVDGLVARVGAAEQHRHRYIQPSGQPCQCRQAARGLRILDFRQHRLRDPDLVSQLHDGQSGVATQRPDLPGNRGLEIVAGHPVAENFPLHGRRITGIAHGFPTAAFHAASLAARFTGAGLSRLRRLELRRVCAFQALCESNCWPPQEWIGRHSGLLIGFPVESAASAGSGRVGSAKLCADRVTFVPDSCPVMSTLRSVLLLCWRDTGHPQGGGTEAYLERIGAQLSASGVAVTLRTARYPGAQRRETVDGVRITRAGGRYSVYLWALAAIARSVRQGSRPDPGSWGFVLR